MKMRKVRSLPFEAPSVLVGCMRQAGYSAKPFTPPEMNSFIHSALDLGANWFDHADIYADGRPERVFGEAWAGDSSLRREDMILQSKCGICRWGGYDSSRDYILRAVDGILGRLQTEYLDVLLLHRPDALIEPEEVAEAFASLKAAGKVRYFGVSNYTPGQIALLQKYVEEPLIINQMEFSLAHAGMVSAGIEANLTTAGGVDRDGGVLDYCRLHDITIQTWSPFQIGLRDGSFLGNPAYAELNRKLEELGEKYGSSPTGMAAAWILRHPAGMQLITGTSRVERLREIVEASDITLSREDWYALYKAAGHPIP